MAMSSEDSRDLTLTSSVEFFPQLVENSTCEQQQEGHCKISFSRDIISNPVSTERYTQESKDDGTQAQSPDCHRIKGYLMSSSMEKLFSLEKISVSEIRSDNGTTLAQCHEREQSVTGQLIASASVNTEDILVRHNVAAAEDRIRAVSPFVELDNIRYVRSSGVAKIYFWFDRHISVFSFRVKKTGMVFCV